jgi:hypothetical protein
MRIVLAVDGSKHGRWSMQWVPRLPLATPPKVTAVHAIDLATLRGPVMPLSRISEVKSPIWNNKPSGSRLRPWNFSHPCS